MNISPWCGKTRICPRCKDKRPLTDFLKDKPMSSCTQCRKVQTVFNKSYRADWLNYLEEHHLTHCWKCGYNKCFAAIDFHHLYPTIKIKAPSSLLQKKITLESIAELEKTLPLCANCHRELHAGLWTATETPKEMNRHRKT